MNQWLMPRKEPGLATRMIKLYMGAGHPLVVAKLMIQVNGISNLGTKKTHLPPLIDSMPISIVKSAYSIRS